MMDALTRRRAFWQPGTGPCRSPPRKVEQLAVDGKIKEDLGRELFVDKVWDWKRESAVPSAARCADSVTGGLGRDRFTMDEGPRGGAHDLR